MNELELRNLAVEMAAKAYAPYSGFYVGAALLAKSGKVYLGCNIENAAYSVCVCAERTALFKAVSEGEREFEAIAIAGGRGGEIKAPCPPCGACRQALSEFCDSQMPIILASEDGYIKTTLGELLPMTFELLS